MKSITGEPLTRLDSGKLRTAQAIHSAHIIMSMMFYNYVFIIFII